ncbi:hypothetical protein QPO66_000899 [Salmonella enterica]|nr:hypothetical protein [Salmonella enterica]EHV9882934.1 hypothetical protein [Salmonella enterica subsp. enterica serovar Durham]EIP0098482.1 hypothetical protein [Salmonella enterica subsp. enterica serovar Wangata]EHF9643854.1 hypothetical protein [Salmonella enterica]EHW9737344.1 hypothetical protein [Salmonella enterica subsp. enterica serovar Durham]
MTRYMHGKVSFALKWYHYSNENYPEGYTLHRNELITELIELGVKAADNNLDEDFEEISILLDYLEEGKELKPLSLMEFAI